MIGLVMLLLIGLALFLTARVFLFSISLLFGKYKQMLLLVYRTQYCNLKKSALQFFKTFTKS